MHVNISAFCDFMWGLCAICCVAGLMMRVDKIRGQIAPQASGTATVSSTPSSVLGELPTAENMAIEDGRSCSGGQWPLAVPEPTSESPSNGRGECRLMAGKRPPTLSQSDFGSFSHLERVVDLDTEVSHGAFQLGMA